MPEPSRLLKLEQLPSTTTTIGTKIRFLGCVHDYDTTTALLTLRDHYPATAKDVPTIFVSIDNIKDGLDHELLAVGSWLNVMGALRARPQGFKVSRQARVAFVDATIVWSAGAVRLERYQDAVDGYQGCVARDAV
ncbi:hypothetical protein LTR78_001508 [Recurvomyces mirabilis]|uniref:Uncharacterized protein n=1 Tax=Recurvomyces mirabilis TaxID=574656 RepID=A0AAE0WVU6_9PEZI|nr:hypothetical protein LTR78_001508 [Recurvomyces mirabilis]KAK5161487.1 hypothetical protein LTS14_001283 [Recurvomyces mirabilis]